MSERSSGTGDIQTLTEAAVLPGLGSPNDRGPLEVANLDLCSSETAWRGLVEILSPQITGMLLLLFQFFRKDAVT